MSAPRPPRVARAVLERVLDPADRPYALADLDEEFETLAEASGPDAARRWYRRQVAASLLPALRSRLRRTNRSGGPAEAVREWGRDLRLAVRTLARSPLTVAVTVVSLGLGLGAVTTVFAAAEGVIWPPDPGYRDAERLVTVYTSEDDGGPWGASSFADYQDVAALPSVADAAAATVSFLEADLGQGPERLIAEVVTPNYFTLTGLRPAVGRTLLPSDPGESGPVVVIAHDLWRERFGGASDAVGRSIQVGGRLATVVGVAPEGLGSRRVPLVRPDLWVPFDPAAGRAPASRREARELVVLARLADDATLDRLSGQLGTLATALNAEYPDAWLDERGRDRRFTAMPERDSRVAPTARAVLGAVAGFFFGTAGLVLLIACANVTGLFLVRALARRRELAVRAALGAGRARIVRLLAAEGLVLGAASAVVGIFVARLMSDALGRIAPPVDVPLRLTVEPGGRALVFTAVLALAVSLVFSLVPAIRGARPATGSRPGAGAVGVRRRWRPAPGGLLVGAQFAAAFVLLAGSGLFLRSVHGAAARDLGVDPSGVAVTTRTAPETVGSEGLPAWYADVMERAGRGAGVQRVALSRSLELTLLQLGALATVRTGAPDEPPGGLTLFANAVTPGYLEMLDVELLQGRTIDESDGPDGEPVAVVNRRFAEQFWPGEDALGRTFELARRSGDEGTEGTRSVRVVGIAATSPAVDFDDAPAPYVWTSLAQDPAPTVVVAVEGPDAERLAGDLRTLLPPADGEVPVLGATTYASQLSLQSIHLRVMARVLAWGGGLGLFLAVIGVYGVVSFMVVQRMRELAIRRAVGAGRSRVVLGVLRRGLVLAGGGLLAGALVLLPTAPLVRGLLVDVAPLDPLSLGGAALLLLVVAALASWVPARRAVGVDPMRVLGRE